MNTIAVVGIDLAKNIFQIHGVDARDHKVVNKSLRRTKMLKYFAQLSPCIIGIEACGSSHYWARELTKLGHTVKLMAPQYVKPYVKGNKNDFIDAAAIAEASSRPDMRFVPTKSESAQPIAACNRIREGVVLLAR